MTKYRLTATEPVQTAFLEGDFLPGKVYDLPDKQPDGTPIVWSEEHWAPVTPPPAPVVTPTPENESSQ